MKTKQVNPMPALVGVGFDIQFANNHKEGAAYSYAISVRIDYLSNISDEGYTPKGSAFSQMQLCRPRPNNPQVLPDWGWLDNPLLDGAVWEVNATIECVQGLGQVDPKQTNKQLVKLLRENKPHNMPSYDEVLKLHWLSFKGVQKGSQLEDWAKENDVPLYDENMEVVK